MYLAEKRAEKDVDILEWWKMHEKSFKSLAKMARDYLAIQATSVQSERVFSKSSLVIRKHRNRLCDKSVRHLMTLNSWVTCSLAREIESNLQK